MPRTLITGGAGFIGSHLCERFINLGHEVVCVDNQSTGCISNVTHLLQRGNFTYIGEDVTLEKRFDYCSLFRYEQPLAFDNILHFASPASPPEYLRLPIETLEAGALGTRNMLRLAVDVGARFLLASTSEVYGDPLQHPQREDYLGNVSCTGPRSVYDEAKRFAEALTMAYHRKNGVDTRIVRIFNTYGPRMKLDDGRAVPNFIGQALRGEPLTIYGSGRQTRSFCHVDDLVTGIVLLLEADYHEPVNLGNPEEVSILQLAAEIRRMVWDDRSVIEVRPALADDPQQRCPDISRAKRLLGWEPRVSREDGLRRTVEWFRERLAFNGDGVSQEKVSL